MLWLFTHSADSKYLLFVCLGTGPLGFNSKWDRQACSLQLQGGAWHALSMRLQCAKCHILGLLRHSVLEKDTGVTLPLFQGGTWPVYHFSLLQAGQLSVIAIQKAEWINAHRWNTNIHPMPVSTNMNTLGSVLGLGVKWEGTHTHTQDPMPLVRSVWRSSKTQPSFASTPRTFCLPSSHTQASPTTVWNTLGRPLSLFPLRHQVETGFLRGQAYPYHSLLWWCKVSSERAREWVQAGSSFMLSLVLGVKDLKPETWVKL